MPSSSVAALYASTLLSGVAYAVRTRAQGIGCAQTTLKRLLNDFQLRCTAIASQRSQQVVLDVLVRRPSLPGAGNVRSLCTPHFPHDLTRTVTAKRWSRRSVRNARVKMQGRSTSVRKAPHSKARLDLAMRLWYTLQRCLRKHATSCGALLPYSVATRKSLRVSRNSTSAAGRNHANFIYLHFDHEDSANTRVRCVLIEPNGPAAARAYKDGLTRLRHAWAKLVDEGVVLKGKRRLILQSKVDILGDKGAQTMNEVERNLHALVSPRSVLTRRYRSRRGRLHTTTTTRYEGHGAGICGAVTHWIVHRWLRADTSRTLEDVYAELCGWAAAYPQAALDDLKAFMQDVRKQTRVMYADNVDAALRRDMTTLQTALQATYGPTFESGHVVLSCKYTFRQGTETLYHASHEIVVRSTR